MQQAYNKLLTLIILGAIFWTGQTFAVCPVCVVAVGAGLGFSEWLGIDDVISSIWIGALLVALVIWTINEMRKRGKKFRFDKTIIFLAYYLLTYIPLYYAGVIGHPLNKIFGIDKIIFGSILGTLLLPGAYFLHLYFKKINGGKSYFPFQKVAIPLAVLLLTSLITWIMLKSL